MTGDTDRLYKEGVAAIRAGDKESARTKLMQVVEIDQTHEQAWLWLSAAVEKNEDRIICLQNVLTINPNNEAARKGLEKLGASTAVDTNVAGYDEEPPMKAPPPAEPSHRMEHGSSWVAQNMQMSKPEREMFSPAPAGPRAETPAAAKSSLPPEESWRAALLDDSREMGTPNSAKYMREVKGVREPRGFLDLVNTWGDMLIFRMGEFEREYKNAGFGHIMINILVASILAAILLSLKILLLDALTPGGRDAAFADVFTQTFGPGTASLLGVDGMFKTIASPSFLGIGLVVIVLGMIVFYFLRSMFESFILDRVCSLLQGKGDIIETLHAIVNVQVVAQIAQIPVLLITPFLSPTAAFYVTIGIGLYPFLLKARAVGNVHKFGWLVGIGALIINGVAMYAILFFLLFCLLSLAAFGSS
jgi:hypothetical protein